MENQSALVSALVGHGIPVKRAGDRWASNWCPCCGPSSKESNKLSIFRSQSGKERWHCFKCDSTGDIFDLMTHLQGISLKEALKQAKDMGIDLDKRQIDAQRSSPASPERQEAIEKVIKILLEKAPRHELYGMKYLTQERGLLPVVLARAAEKGVLRFLPGGINWQANRKWLADVCGRKLLEKAGIWKPDKKAPALAFRPILTFLPYGKSFEARVIESKPGTPKSIRFGVAPYPYWLPANIHGANRVYIVEGIIDGLSINQMFPAVNVVAIPGSTSWKPEWLGRLKAFFNRRGNDVEIIIATDNDEAGDKAAEKIAHFCKGASIPYSRSVPDNGYNDWNEMLLNMSNNEENVAYT